MAPALRQLLALACCAVSRAPAASVYPFVHEDSLRAYGLENEALSTALPSLVLIKTFKTGGSTVAAITNRIADARHLRKMVPEEGDPYPPYFLGWPGAFPGRVSAAPRHQFDLINNHAVLARAPMARFMRTRPLFFSIVREPHSRMVSAFNYYKPHSRAVGAGQHSWEDLISLLRSYDHCGFGVPDHCDQFINGMATSFGWRAAQSNSLAHDQDDEHIATWLGALEAQVDVMLVLEKLDESLLLLREKVGLNLTLPELSYLPMKLHGEGVVGAAPNGTHHPNSAHAAGHAHPSAAQRLSLRPMLRVDMALHAHFLRRHEREWAAAVSRRPAIEADLRALRCLNARLAQDCEALARLASLSGGRRDVASLAASTAHPGEAAASPRCSAAMLTDSLEYTARFQRRKGWGGDDSWYLN